MPQEQRAAHSGRNGTRPEGPPPRDSRQRGRPRSDRAHRALLEAARSLLAETGLARLNLEQVAARAGVGKATIYRHWPTREALALELLLEMADAMVPTPQVAGTREELVATVAGAQRALTTPPLGHVLRCLLSDLAANPALGEPFRARVTSRWREKVANILARAVHRGDIRPDADLGIAAELLFGPIYYHLLFGGDGSSDLAERAVDALLRGYGSAHCAESG